MNHRIIRHVNQSVTEYWSFSHIHGWQPVSIFIADDWKRNTWDYIELRHSMPINKLGFYGPNIKG